MPKRGICIPGPGGGGEGGYYEVDPEPQTPPAFTAEEASFWRSSGMGFVHVLTAT